MKRITVAVITCRRPLWLKRLLVGLSTQKVNENVELDILVVDNASDTETKEAVESVKPQCPFPIHYDVEEKPGIVFARNKCVDLFLASQSDYLIFIDDDEWPQSPTWAQTLLNSAESNDVDVVTSHVISVGEPGTPEWAIKLIYGRNPYTQGQKIDVFYTNNLLLSRNILTTIHPAFDDRFAMTGASDYHFALKSKLKGFECVYVDAPVEEEFPKSRATIKWFTRRGFRSGIGYTRSHLFEEPTAKVIIRCLAMSAVRFVRGIGYLLLGAITFNKQTFVDGLFRLCSSYGTIAGFFGVKHEEYKVIHGK